MGAILAKLKDSNRPATEEKLCNLLRRSSCYQFSYHLPPGDLAQAMLAPLKLNGCSAELFTLVECLSLASRAFEESNREEEIEPVGKLQERIAKLEEKLGRGGRDP